MVTQVPKDVRKVSFLSMLGLDSPQVHQVASILLGIPMLVQLRSLLPCIQGDACNPFAATRSADDNKKGDIFVKGRAGEVS